MSIYQLPGLECLELDSSTQVGRWQTPPWQASGVSRGVILHQVPNDCPHDDSSRDAGSMEETIRDTVGESDFNYPIHTKYLMTFLSEHILNKWF